METPNVLDVPDQHLDPLVASSYDAAVSRRFAADEVDAAVRFLSDLADGGPAVEFAIGTGRIALPLSEVGVLVKGVDISEPMLAQLAAKPGADRIEVAVGDMTTTMVCSDARVVYLVFNTITNLRSQDAQVACFRNAAAHLRPGGYFVIENGVPKLHQLPSGETIRPFDVSANHLGFDEYVDLANQILVSHHYFIAADRVRQVSGAFRYVWPSELDLMAQIAGLEFHGRWADWERSPFDAASPAHVSVWRKPG